MGGAWVFPGGATHAEDRDERATARRELEEEAGIGLPGDAELVRYSRWITPAELSRRFDTHFFVAEAPERTEAAIDGVECVDVRWIRPQAALDAGARGELMLVVPTIKHLEQLAGHESVAEALATARARKVAPCSRACWSRAEWRGCCCPATRATPPESALLSTAPR